MLRIARDADATGMSSAEAIEVARERERERAALSRRTFLGGMAAASVMLAGRKAMAAPKTPSVDVAIVGAGLAGLQCAYNLGQAGVMVDRVLNARR